MSEAQLSPRIHIHLFQAGYTLFTYSIQNLRMYAVLRPSCFAGAGGRATIAAW